MMSPYAMNREDMRIMMALPEKFLDNTCRTADEIRSRYFICKLPDYFPPRPETPLVVTNRWYDLIEENYPESLHHYARMEPKMKSCSCGLEIGEFDECCTRCWPTLHPHSKYNETPPLPSNADELPEIAKES